MGEIRDRPPVKLICGFIYGTEEHFNGAFSKLEHLYGEADFVSELIEFDHTQYYHHEMGGGTLYRRFCCFKKLIPSEDLPDIKIKTNDIEIEFANPEGIRQVNLDPGYISASKLILATTKNQQQRIYLASGIFAEPELYFQNKTFNAWEWSYPDYATEKYIKIFNHIRKIYQHQIKEIGMRFI
ncbi:MAG: DUF4416 family protein [Bacteriovoracaceae bacterium]|nr:DUF4416 family protein [Bacteriovoracaceae bacterium]